MDPQYSVLIGDPNKGECEERVEDDDSNNRLLPLMIVLPIFGAIMLGVLFVLFVLPKYVFIIRYHNYYY